MEKNNVTSITINQSAWVELYLPDMPYYSKVTLFEKKDNKEIGSCGIDPSYRSRLKRAAGDIAKFMAVLTEINMKLPNESLEKLIQHINTCNEQGVDVNFSI